MAISTAFDPGSSRHDPKRRARVQAIARAHDLHVAGVAVCSGHSAPLDFVVEWIYDRPSVSVAHGPRGGGKSFLAGFATHVDSLRYDRHHTAILGGSLAQSGQIFAALEAFDRARPGTMPIRTKTAARYLTGSRVSILAASAKSVRGPHVPTLRLDEVDEIDEPLREAAIGMAMSRKGGERASISFTSTWHRVGGPMEKLRDANADGRIPWHTFCVFEVLERCPDERSGPNLEYCPACPLVKWCHDTSNPVPKAKRSDGHYAIDSLIQKLVSVSRRVFDSDYLCATPRADGVWFPSFEPARHVSTAAEYDPALPVHLAIDTGVFTGAVWFQVKSQQMGGSHIDEVRVFCDYLSEGMSAESNARSILEKGRTHCNGRFDVVSTDPAGGARNPVGPTVIAEYERAGFGRSRLRHWPKRPVADGLALIESFIAPADGAIRLFVHPRCKALITALDNYRRARQAGQWVDRPEDPQHPHEDLVDALRGGLVDRYPDGRQPKLATTPRTVSQIFH